MAQFLRPDGNVTQTSFTGGFAEIDESTASDADFAYGANNTAAVLEVSLSNPADTPDTGTCTVRYRIAKTNAGTVSGTGNSVNITCEVYQGASQVAADTAKTTSGTWTDYSFTFSTGLVSDWTDLRLRFTTTNSGGSPANRRGGAVSWAEIEAPDAPAAVDGNATGSTLTGTTSLAAEGSATGSASYSGDTLLVTSLFTAGTASGESGGTNGEATGSTLTVTVSRTAGEAVGGATGSGQILSSTATLIVETEGGIELETGNGGGRWKNEDGGLIRKESRKGNATVAGVTQSATVSLVAGEASGDASSGQALYVVTASLAAEGTATGSASYAGETLPITVALLAGDANQDVEGSGATLTATGSLVEGAAFGAAEASGATITTSGSIVEGTATGTASASGETLAVTASLVEGSASAAGSATGATLTTGASLIAGEGFAPIDGTATGSLNTVRVVYGDGVLLTQDGFQLDLEDGSGASLLIQPHAGVAEATGDANAGGATLVIGSALVAGTAEGNPVDGIATGATLTVAASLTAGTASASGAEQPSTGGGGFWRPDASWRRPQPRIDANARGALIEIRVEFVAGAAIGDERLDPVLMDNDLLLFAAAA